MSKVDKFLTDEAARLRREAANMERRRDATFYASQISLNRSHADKMDREAVMASEPDNGDRFW